jgi:prepilin peptidase CpaA
VALPDLLTIGLLAGIAGVGAWLDWHYRLLPNRLCAVALVAGLVVTGLGQGLAALLPHLGHAGLALLVGMALFAGGVIGGGDAKFYAALAAWFPLAEGFRLLLLVALAGLVLTVGLWLFVWRAAPAGPGSAAGARQPRTVPYGVAIAAGAVVALLL